MVRAGGVRHDLSVPPDSTAGGVLEAVGVQLASTDRLLGPDGTAVDLDTPAERLREGGAYSVAQAAQKRASRGRRRASDAAPTASAGVLVWILLSSCGTAALLAALLPDPVLRTVSAAVLGALALLALFAWSRGATGDRALGAALPPVLAALAAALAMPPQVPHAATLAIAAGCFAGAVFAAGLMAVAAELRIRAGAGAAAIVLTAAALGALLAPVAGWDPAQLTIVAGAASIVAVRALPSLSLSVDDGYHVDYGRFMVLRWTVRGRAPEYRPRVDGTQAHQVALAAESRLTASITLLSILAALGMALLALPVAHGGIVEQVAGAAALVLGSLALLLISRRSAAAAVRNPPRLAAALGLLGFVVLCVLLIDEPPLQLIGGVVLFGGALLAAGLVLPLGEGGRSLGWSRMGDIVESMSVALALPSALLAAGTLDTLRGVLVG